IIYCLFPTAKKVKTEIGEGNKNKVKKRGVNGDYRMLDG
ncbi:hypothetical protein LCGC14_2288550, partial [marine sediment metagenome]